MDIRSDLYSLGATIYHMLTGRPPFEGPTAAAIMAKHLTELPKSPRQIDPSDHALGEVIVLRLLQKRREDRYQTPAELLQRVDEVVRSLQAARGVVAGPATSMAPSPLSATVPQSMPFPAAPISRRKRR